MENYDPTALEDLAISMKTRASLGVLIYSVGLLLFGIAAGVLAITLASTLLPRVQLGGGLVGFMAATGLVVGYAVGSERARVARFQANMILCMVAMERHLAKIAAH